MFCCDFQTRLVAGSLGQTGIHSVLVVNFICANVEFSICFLVSCKIIDCRFFQMQSAASPECIPKLEFPEIPNKDELVVSDNLKYSFANHNVKFQLATCIKH